MPRLSKRDRVIRELQQLAEAPDSRQDPAYQRFLGSAELQQASAVLGRAVDVLRSSGANGAFTAVTHTPLPAPPGWLPPPI